MCWLFLLKHEAIAHKRVLSYFHSVMTVVWQTESSHSVMTSRRCDVCKNIFTNSAALMSHLWHNDWCVENNWTHQWYEYQKQKAQWLAKKSFLCNVYGCGRGFGSLQALMDHCWGCKTSESKQAEQWLAMKPFTCSKCHAGCKDATPGCHTRSFRTQDGLDSHMASCGKTELMINIAAAYRLKDLKETQYQCDRCKKDKPNKFFLTKDALSQHEEVCGKSLEDLDRDWMTANPYACRFCNQRFPTERGKGGMENHIYSNHSELLEVEAEDWHASYWQ